MTDPDVPGKVDQDLFVECLADQAHGGADPDAGTVCRGNARALLATMLKGEETVKRHLGNVEVS